MFLGNSRYANLETVTAKDRSGRDAAAVKLRRIPQTDGADTVVSSADRLDIMADSRYADATRYWRIGDANTELEVEDLVQRAGRTILVPPE